MLLTFTKGTLLVCLFGFELIAASTLKNHRPLSATTMGDIFPPSRQSLAKKMISSLQKPQQDHNTGDPSQKATKNDIRDLDRNLQEDDDCIPGFYSWLYDKIGTSNIFDLAEVQVVQLIATSHKGFFDKEDNDESFGPNGMYTDEITKRRQQLDEFWKMNNPFVPTNETLVLGARAEDMLNDRNKLRTIVDIIFCESANICGYSDLQLDDIIASLIDPVVEQHGVDNPALDAIAAVVLDSEELNEYEVDLKGYAIVFGEGMFTFLEDTNQIEHGPVYILAHEYSHVLQDELGLFDDEEESTSLEGLRRLELMADAFAAYFLSHDQGANLSVAEIDNIFLTARSIGDYYTLEEGHHGTPAQRECAVIHYANVGFEETTVATVQDLIVDFDDILPLILEANDEICPNVTLKPECHTSLLFSAGYSIMVTFMTVPLSVILLTFMM